MDIFFRTQRESSIITFRSLLSVLILEKLEYKLRGVLSISPERENKKRSHSSERKSNLKPSRFMKYLINSYNQTFLTKLSTLQ